MVLLHPVDCIKIAVVSPELRIADVTFNKNAIMAIIEGLLAQDCDIAVFPELCLTGVTCGDLFLQSIIQEQCLAALLEITNFLKSHKILVTIGFPMKIGEDLFNCVSLIDQDGILGVRAKTNLAGFRMGNERRWFSPGATLSPGNVEIKGRNIPISGDLSFQTNGPLIQTIALEIGEASSLASPNGPILVLNPCADIASIGSLEEKHSRLQQLSAQNRCIVASASSGPNESTTDHLYSGQSMIAANGRIEIETKCFEFSTQTAIAEIDLKELSASRSMNKSLSLKPIVDNKNASSQRSSGFFQFTQTPFIPARLEEQDQACQQAFEIQVTGLARRLRATGSQHVVLGMSGGMDSSLAFLVCVKAFEKLGLNSRGVTALFLPGPGTSLRSRSNCQQLANQFDVSFREISISDAFYQHLKDIEHQGLDFDLTYENAQARERTQILMDLAGMIGGFVVGTGDLSELALGWCTYNADHMSMYNVNAGIPKTFVKAELAWYGRFLQKAELAGILTDIIESPISPELLPLSGDLISPQKTEDQIGPYLLHDFFLFHTLKHGSTPAELLKIACDVFTTSFTPKEIIKWMRIFYNRFITQQFKRSAMPDGPSVFSVDLSPRGGWVMPSDASPELWLDALAKIELDLSRPQAGEANG